MLLAVFSQKRKSALLYLPGAVGLHTPGHDSPDKTVCENFAENCLRKEEVAMTESCGECREKVTRNEVVHNADFDKFAMALKRLVSGGQTPEPWIPLIITHFRQTTQTLSESIQFSCGRS